MRKLFLMPVKIDSYVETVDKQPGPFDDWEESKPETSQTEENGIFTDDLYEDNKHIERTVKNTDRFKQYNFDTSYLMSLKGARVSSEIKTPFVILKHWNKGKRISEFDTVYRTDQKIKYNEYRQGVRLGFIRAADKFKYAHYNLDKTQQVIGIVNDEYPIRKNKGINQRKVGYIKLDQGSDLEDYYVEVTQSHKFIWMILITIALLLVMIKPAMQALPDIESIQNWKFNSETFSLNNSYMIEVQITCKSEVELTEGTIDLGIETSGEDNLQYKTKIYLKDEASGQLLYEGSLITVGQGQGIMELEGIEDLAPGEYDCTAAFEIYRDASAIEKILDSSSEHKKINSVTYNFILKV